MPSTRSATDNVARLIEESSTIVAFTGAGISTASGIPDFRSPSSGLWEKHDPMTVASLMGFRQNPQAFFDWVSPLISRIVQAEPNKAHQALAKLETLGKLKGVITQNIDGLHQKAGNTIVHELHGHLRTGTCTRCFKKYPAEPLIEQLLQEQSIPTCDCQTRGAVIKPDVILFGEQLPQEIFNQAMSLLEQADLLLVAGSSLSVHPANLIPLTAARNGAKVVIINYDKTPVDKNADIVINDDVNKILPQIMDTLEMQT